MAVLLYKYPLIVITYSGRTQAAIILGMIGFIVINFVGGYSLAHFHITGPMTGLTDVISEKFAHRYDKAAFGDWLSSSAIRTKGSFGIAFSCSMA